MPREKESLQNKLRRLIKPYDKILTTDGKIVYCSACEQKFVVDRKQHVSQHIAGVKHKKNCDLQQEKKSRQTLLRVEGNPETTSQLDSFKISLCRALLSADIPWIKLENSEFRAFLETNVGRSMPNESTLRKSYLNVCYEQVSKKSLVTVQDSTCI